MKTETSYLPIKITKEMKNNHIGYACLDCGTIFNTEDMTHICREDEE
jgi:hypothetical protein